MRLARLLAVTGSLLGLQLVFSPVSAQPLWYRLDEPKPQMCTQEEARREEEEERKSLEAEDEAERAEREVFAEEEKPKHAPLGASLASDREMLLRASITASKLLYAAGHKFYRLNPNWGQFKTPPKWPYIVLMAGTIGDGKEVSPAMAARECRCIAVDMVAYRMWLERLVGRPKLKELGNYPESILVYMLLHEVGHIRHRDAVGRFDSSSGTLSKARNLDKDVEDRADRFAGNTLHIASRMYPNARSEFSAAMEVEMSLLMLNSGMDYKFEEVDWDLFASKMTGDPEYYWDKSATHPNIRLRLLSILAMTSPTAFKGQLDDFMDVRRTLDPKVFSARKELYARSLARQAYRLPDWEIASLLEWKTEPPSR